MAKEITMQDVAEYANVSVATVSRVLNQTGKVKEDTRARVMDAISTLGFVQNVSVRSVADTLGERASPAEFPDPASFLRRRSPF